MIHKKCFKELSGEDMMRLAETSHNFTFYNWVHNSSSAITPFRMISNTSSVSSCTTISTEQLSPTNVLNPQEHGLIRFCLYAVPLCGDVAGAYHTIDVDVASSYLRLFFYFWDLPGCSKPRIFRQTSILWRQRSCPRTRGRNIEVCGCHCCLVGHTLPA